MVKKVLNYLSDKGILIVILTVGFLLRVYSLGGTSLWKDEIFSTIEANKSLIELLTVKSWDYYGYAPVHYVITHIATFFGSDEFIVRFPAALFGFATLVVVYFLTKDIFGKRTAMLATLLLAISTIHVQYSREVRYYSYLTFFSSLTILASYKVVAEKRKWKWIILFLFASLFNLATQLTALLVLSAEIIFFLSMLTLSVWKKRRKLLKKHRPKRIISVKNIALLLVCIILFFLIFRFLSSFQDFLSTVKFQPTLPLSLVFKRLVVGLSGNVYLALLFISLFILGLTTGFRENKDGLVLLLLSFLIPPVAIYLYRPANIPGFELRYIVFIVVPYLCLVANGLSTIFKFRPLYYLSLVLILFFVFQSLSGYYSYRRGDWRGVANYIKTNGSAGDVVIPDGDYNVMLLDYYLNTQKNGFVIKKPVEALVPSKVPFRIFYFQHDYQNPDGSLNLDELFITDYEKTISFKAEVSPLHIVVSKPIYYWQEAEQPATSSGWVVTDIYSQKFIQTDVFSGEGAFVSYKINVVEKGQYELYANLRRDNSPGMIKYRLDNLEWSDGFQPSWQGVGARTKEIKLGSLDLTSGNHELAFKNQSVGSVGLSQAIDYFYLVKATGNNVVYNFRQ